MKARFESILIWALPPELCCWEILCQIKSKLFFSQLTYRQCPCFQALVVPCLDPYCIRCTACLSTSISNRFK